MLQIKDKNSNLTIKSFEPIASEKSRVLILGTMPGAASLCKGQYYGHPQNQFWLILSKLLGFCTDLEYSKRCEFIAQKGIALWDVLKSCKREGSLDSRIENEKPNDVAAFLQNHKSIKAVFFNGANAEKFFKKYIAQELIGLDNLHFERLASTSPANASIDLNQKVDNWRRLLEFLD